MQTDEVTLDEVQNFVEKFEDIYMKMIVEFSLQETKNWSSTLVKFVGKMRKNPNFVFDARGTKVFIYVKAEKFDRQID